MKKAVLLLVIILVVTGAVFAQSAASILAAIPAATYTCAADGSTWVFAATGITVSDASGSCTIPAEQMKDLSAITAGFSFSFATSAHSRTYRFTVNPVSGDITRNIVKDGIATPQVTLTRR